MPGTGAGRPTIGGEGGTQLAPGDHSVPGLLWALSRRHFRLAAWLIGLGSGLGAVLITWGPAGLLLAVGVGAGTGITYLSGLRLGMDERLAYGTVLGSALVAGSAFFFALILGLTPITVALAAAATLALGGAGWVRGWPMVGRDLQETLEQWRRLEPWPLWALLAGCWLFIITLLSRAYQSTPSGLVTGNGAVYGDWAVHLTYASSFAYGNNFPPQSPIYAGHALTYPFMIDFWAATLMALGAPATSALVLTSGLLCLALPAVIYFAWVRLAGDRTAAGLAVLLFLAGGGLGFLLLLGRWGPAPTFLTADASRNLVWVNPVLAWLIPQRSTLFGISLVPMGLALLWSARQQASSAPFLFVGALTGSMPLLHFHAFGTLTALAGIWAAFDLLSRRQRALKQWGAFCVAALPLGLPAAAWLLSGGTSSLRLQPGWMAAADGHNDNWLWFWLWNTGLLAPLLLVALAWPGLLRNGLAPRLAPIWLWFLVPNLIVFHPWDWDNTKFFAFWALIGSLPVALLLQRLNRRVTGLGMLLLVSLTASGLIDLSTALDPARNTYYFTDPGGIQAAAWVRDHTDRRAVFLVAPDINEPIQCLSGRTVVAGYQGWLNSYGLPDWRQRLGEVGTMLQGQPGTPELVRRYGVDYVVMGPQELAAHANRVYWNASARIVYERGGYTIYRTLG
jgi:hypothetical protein